MANLRKTLHLPYLQALRPAPKAKLSDDQLAFAALAGGALSALATIPMDVLVSTKQAASKAGHSVSILETFREQVRAGGVAGTVKFACRGLSARVLHVAMTTFMMRFMTTRVCEFDILAVMASENDAALIFASLLLHLSRAIFPCR